MHIISIPAALLSYVKKWNTNSKYCRIAQSGKWNIAISNLVINMQIHVTEVVAYYLISVTKVSVCNGLILNPILCHCLSVCLSVCKSVCLIAYTHSY